MARPLMTSDGPLEHDARARLSARQKRLLEAAAEVMVKDEKRQAKAEGRGESSRGEADVIRLALDHLIDTHPAFASVKRKQKSKGGRG